MDPVRAIADAVLYEGYVLWPYRRSALKNQRRWTFGGVYPPAHAAAHPDDPATMRAQVLLEARRRGRRRRALPARRPPPGGGRRAVDEVEVDGERTGLGRGHRARGRPGRASRSRRGRSAGGRAAVARARARARRASRRRESAPGSRLTRRDRNNTPFDGGDREAALRQTFCSTHTVLRGRGAAFVSATDPPERCGAVAPAQRAHVAGARRRARRPHHDARLADHPRGPPADRPREPGRPLRRRRDRPAAGAQHPRA